MLENTFNTCRHVLERLRQSLWNVLTVSGMFRGENSSEVGVTRRYSRVYPIQFTTIDVLPSISGATHADETASIARSSATVPARSAVCVDDRIGTDPILTQPHRSYKLNVGDDINTLDCDESGTKDEIKDEPNQETTSKKLY